MICDRIKDVSNLSLNGVRLLMYVHVILLHTISALTLFDCTVIRAHINKVLPINKLLFKGRGTHKVEKHGDDSEIEIKWPLRFLRPDCLGRIGVL